MASAEEFWSSARIEGLVDLEDLLDDSLPSNGEGTEWTEEELLRIAKPFFHRSPCNWPVNSKRVDLLNRKNIDVEKIQSKELRKLIVVDLNDYLRHHRDLPSSRRPWSLYESHHVQRRAKVDLRVDSMILKAEGVLSDKRKAGKRPSEASEQAVEAWLQIADYWEQLHHLNK
jgi:hypothetical protein